MWGSLFFRCLHDAMNRSVLWCLHSWYLRRVRIILIKIAVFLYLVLLRRFCFSRNYFVL